MSEPRGGAGAPRRTAPTRRKPRRRVSVVGVFGELLISAGVFVLLFLGWQLWFNDLVVDGQLRDESLQQSSTWQGNASTAEHGTSNVPPVLKKPGATGDIFGLMIIPRFGDKYYKPIAEGTGTAEVLNKGEIGHYPTSSMPGAVGNFAVAAHRTSYGKPFNRLSNLRAGDHIFVETTDGWYQYDVPQPRVRAADRRRRHRACSSVRRGDAQRPAHDDDQLQPAVLGGASASSRTACSILPPASRRPARRDRRDRRTGERR